MDKWKILSKKKVLQAKLFDVEELKIDSNSKIKIHHIAKRNPTVSVLPLTSKGEIYLISQYRYMLNKTTLEVMAGFIEKNETPIKAAKRELLEETGIKAKYWKKLIKLEMAGSVFKSNSHLFLARGLVNGLPEPDEDENIKLVKISLEKAVRKVLSGEINHSSSVIGILFLDKIRREGKL